MARTQQSRPQAIVFRVSGLALILMCLLSGCKSNKVQPLMPTPLIYQQSDFGPIDDIPEEEHFNLRSVFYVTNRERENNLRRIVYGNDESEQVTVGLALIGFGDYDLTWSDLSNQSKASKRETEIPLSIAGLLEAGRLEIESDGTVTDTKGGASWLMREFEEAIERSRNKDVLIYVHGAKVDFYNACAFAAQLDHFMGRDMTSVAFSWPSRQNISAYVIGDDLQRGRRAASALSATIRIIAEQSSAERINIVCWSAGGRVVTKALTQLYDTSPNASEGSLHEQYRIGTVYYAAADVPRDEFIEALPKINALADKIVVTASTEDQALKQAPLVMGGSTRIGQIPTKPLSDPQREAVFAADRFEYVDMSTGSDQRGFNIAGHRYWYDHPWASTDLLLAVRTGFTPEERGLIPGVNAVHWIVPEDYPERIQNMVEKYRSKSHTAP
ncbi:alpha/beta hydrolase [Coraliomargarita akajimensis]|nr:alpha/beta hydrolase [Coraliomargarita akajimensis]